MRWYTALGPGVSPHQMPEWFGSSPSSPAEGASPWAESVRLELGEGGVPDKEADPCGM